MEEYFNEGTPFKSMANQPALSKTAVISRFTYCVTYPPYKMIDNTTAVLNMDAYCGCGKQYKEHKEWQEWMSKNGL